MNLEDFLIYKGYTDPLSKNIEMLIELSRVLIEQNLCTT